ncbi:MAG: hypothetical protein AUJ72_05330 [Candidatus Omnitrophica bacterium CG1_02_46_14]|nr:MAG: hypothetical protein AUJ72_05330 [Candidatus Omnitrophica bacterium CG1_02_46_14]
MEKIEYTGGEKRKYQRLNKQFVVRIQIPEISKEWDMVLIKDISKGGLLFRYHKEFGVGMSLNLKISVAFNKSSILCVGKIVRIKVSGNPKSYDVGISFTKLAESNALLIESVIEKISSDKTKKEQRAEKKLI